MQTHRQLQAHHACSFPSVIIPRLKTNQLNWNFTGALEVCELDDLGFSGDIFTWRNKQTTGNTHIRERLDRAVANARWRMKFPLMHVKNGDPYHSDHRPVVLSTEMIQRGGGGGCGFKFEASWIKEEGC